jgi:hypothetical protein
MERNTTHIGIIGGGPSAMFVYKQLVASGSRYDVTIFERSERLGAGMPYSASGSGDEHVTNVSSNEVPELPVTPVEWLAQHSSGHDGIRPLASLNEYKVFPRLQFGNYLEDQFHGLLRAGAAMGIGNTILFSTKVTDIQYQDTFVVVTTSKGTRYEFQKVILCTGHQFPMGLDEESTGIYTSPYPPQKLHRHFNHAVAIRGASLTAVDAIKTLSKANGSFYHDANGSLKYKRDENVPDFKIFLHCRSGMLPGVRFHLKDSRLKNPALLSLEDIHLHRIQNDGYLSLDYIFEKDFKDPIKYSDPAYYQKIKGMNLEEFVAYIVKARQAKDPFVQLREDCAEASRSIKHKKSVYWKEMLGVLSFALNYPAKYFSAEDMLRYKRTLHPLMGLIIAYIPQSSCRELLALHDAGCLDVVNVGHDSEVVPSGDRGIVYRYRTTTGDNVATDFATYIDCTGQPQLEFKDFPFQGLIQQGTVKQATLPFRDQDIAGEYSHTYPENVVTDGEGNIHLKVPGVVINDNFQVIGKDGSANHAIYLMAVPCMGGYNPDYSGLDFAEEASKRIVDALQEAKTYICLAS